MGERVTVERAMEQKGRPGNFNGDGGTRDSSGARSTLASDDSPASSPGLGERDARDRREAADVPPGARVFECPECHHKEPTPDELGVHLERHRPVHAAGPGLVPCPHGCGRHFGRGYHSETASVELREHRIVCDGQPPLLKEPEQKKEEAMAGFPCAGCGESLKNARSLGQHLRYCKKTKPTKPSAADPAPEDPEASPGAGKSVKEQTIDFLREIKAHYQGKIDEVDNLLAAVHGVEEPKS